MRAKGEAEYDHVMNFVKTGVRTAADELVGRALGPVLGPLAAHAGKAAVHALLDDEEEDRK
jgi:hypothetical protein